MAYLTLKAARMLSKRLKRIIKEDIGQEVRLGWCQSAIAEAFDFGSASEMFGGLPVDKRWNRDWCINHLVDERLVGGEAAANSAVTLLEERYANLLTGLSSPPTGDHDARCRG